MMSVEIVHFDSHRTDTQALATGVDYGLSRGIFNFQFYPRKGYAMITLTRLNGQAFVINAEKIRYVEATPDTVVCCDSGEKMMVREAISEVIRRAIEYARVVRRPITD
jgi:flagellar protein FlbD